LIIFMNTKNRNRQRAVSALAAGPRQVSLNHHKAHCVICTHSDRADIEEDFLPWRSAGDIAEEHQVGDRRTVYRHAHATGLWQRRRRNLRAALESLIEGVDTVEVTGDTVIRAAIAHARINDEGRYVDPTRRIIVTHKRQAHAKISRHTAHEIKGPND
jgi:hypothetical protein